jgi:mercuric ion transport protein
VKFDRVLKTGIIGTVLIVICCVTPILVIALGAVGLAAWTGWLDLVLLPALGVFLCILGYGLWRCKRATPSDTPSTGAADGG